MSDLVRDAREDVGGRQARERVTSSTLPPGRELLSLDIDLASRRAMTLCGTVARCRTGSRKYYLFFFLFFSYCIFCANAINIPRRRAIRRRQGSPALRVTKRKQ
jgi:hypothetical protein